MTHQERVTRRWVTLIDRSDEVGIKRSEQAAAEAGLPDPTVKQPFKNLAPGAQTEIDGPDHLTFELDL